MGHEIWLRLAYSLSYEFNFFFFTAGGNNTVRACIVLKISVKMKLANACYVIITHNLSFGYARHLLWFKESEWFIISTDGKWNEAESLFIVLKAEGCKTIIQQADSHSHEALGPGLTVFMGKQVTSKHLSEWKTCVEFPQTDIQHIPDTIRVKSGTCTSI